MEAMASVVPTTSKPSGSNIERVPTNAMVVSMRPIPASRVADAATISGRFPAVHGAPVHIGAPEDIGITDLAKPDFGDAVRIEPGEIPVFWACGVTPQAAVMHSRPEFAIGHAPGHMAITDARDSAYLVP